MRKLKFIFIFLLFNIGSHSLAADQYKESALDKNKIGANSALKPTLSSLVVKHYVNSMASLKNATKIVTPGEAIILMNGNYNFSGSFHWSKSNSGLKGKKIYLMAEEKHKVVITGTVKMLFDANHLVISGLIFKNMKERIVITGDDFRLTNNKFISSQSPVQIKASNGEIDNNLWTGSLGMSLMMAQPSIDCRTHCEYYKNNHIHHNTWKNIIRGKSNGGEAIMLGYGFGNLHPQFDNKLNALIENNLFSNAQGDYEIISIKSDKNIIKNNCFENNGLSNLTVRMGSDNQITNNSFLNNTGPGLNISGNRNTIASNIFSSNGTRSAIEIHNEGRRADSLDFGNLLYIGSKDNKVVNNTFNNYKTVARDYKIVGKFLKFSNNNHITNNKFFPNINNKYELNTSRTANQFKSSLKLSGNSFSAKPLSFIKNCSSFKVYSKPVEAKPELLNINAKVNDKNAVVSYATNVLADDFINYGPTIKLGTIARSYKLALKHIFNLKNLTPNTNYFYVVCSKSSISKYKCSSRKQFKTLVLKPELLNINAKINDKNAVVSYATNVLADDFINYGPTIKLGTIARSYKLALKHIFNLKNLTPNTNYFYVVCSKSSISKYKCSSRKQFKTLVVKPELLNINSQTKDKNAVVSYATNVLSDDFINYGPTIKLGTITRSYKLALNHIFNLQNLKPNTIYFYVVCSKSSISKYKCSSRKQFKTLPLIASQALKPVASAKNFKGYANFNRLNTKRIVAGWACFQGVNLRPQLRIYSKSPKNGSLLLLKGIRVSLRSTPAIHNVCKLKKNFTYSYQLPSEVFNAHRGRSIVLKALIPGGGLVNLGNIGVNIIQTPQAVKGVASAKNFKGYANFNRLNTKRIVAGWACFQGVNHRPQLRIYSKSPKNGSLLLLKGLKVSLRSTPAIHKVCKLKNNYTYSYQLPLKAFKAHRGRSLILKAVIPGGGLVNLGNIGVNLIK